MGSCIAAAIHANTLIYTHAHVHTCTHTTGRCGAHNAQTQSQRVGTIVQRGLRRCHRQSHQICGPPAPEQRRGVIVRAWYGMRSRNVFWVSYVGSDFRDREIQCMYFLVFFIYGVYTQDWKTIMSYVIFITLCTCESTLPLFPLEYMWV